MTSNLKAWTLGFIFGILGIIVSAFVFIFVALKTGYILGLITVLCGALAGGAFGIGYRIGKGKLYSKAQVTTFEHILFFFGLFGLLAAYFGPYLLFDLDFSAYLSLIDFNLQDFAFILAGAIGGYYAGKFFLPSLVASDLHHALAEQEHENRRRR